MRSARHPPAAGPATTPALASVAIRTQRVLSARQQKKVAHEQPKPPPWTYTPRKKIDFGFKRQFSARTRSVLDDDANNHLYALRGASSTPRGRLDHNNARRKNEAHFQRMLNNIRVDASTGEEVVIRDDVASTEGRSGAEQGRGDKLADDVDRSATRHGTSGSTSSGDNGICREQKQRSAATSTPRKRNHESVAGEGEEHALKTTFPEKFEFVSEAERNSTMEAARREARRRSDENRRVRRRAFDEQALIKVQYDVEPPCSPGSPFQKGRPYNRAAVSGIRYWPKKFGCTTQYDPEERIRTRSPEFGVGNANGEAFLNGSPLLEEHELVEVSVEDEEAEDVLGGSGGGPEIPTTRSPLVGAGDTSLLASSVGDCEQRNDAAVAADVDAHLLAQEHTPEREQGHFLGAATAASTTAANAGDTSFRSPHCHAKKKTIAVTLTARDEEDADLVDAFVRLGAEAHVPGRLLKSFRKGVRPPLHDGTYFGRKKKFKMPFVYDYRTWDEFARRDASPDEDAGHGDGRGRRFEVNLGEREDVNPKFQRGKAPTLLQLRGLSAPKRRKGGALREFGKVVTKGRVGESSVQEGRDPAW